MSSSSLLAGGVGYSLLGQTSSAKNSSDATAKPKATTTKANLRAPALQTQPAKAHTAPLNIVDKISVSIKTSPKDATLRLDEKVIGARQITFETNDDFFELSFSHPGYKTQTFNYQKNEDLELNFELEKIETKSPSHKNVKSKASRKTKRQQPKTKKATSKHVMDSIIKSSPYD